EVGIDIPNASVMMIEDADRFGLAQLHQLRGRVGRSVHQSYCFVFTDNANQKTLERLRALVNSHNGFELAEKDLEFRGPGQVYGTLQSGYMPELRIAKLSDQDINQKAKQAVELLFKTDPELKNYPELKNRLRQNEQGLHLE
ncbi:MAG: helicase-related protein, partial [Patescibacteria group bacterium]